MIDPGIVTKVIFGIVGCIFIAALWELVRLFLYIRSAPTLSPGDSLQGMINSAIQTESNETMMNIDIVRQISHNTLWYLYLEKIETLANILPPIGLIGTVIGLILALKPGADITIGLSVKLQSTLAGLSAYTIIEGMKHFLKCWASKVIENALSKKGASDPK